MSAPWPLHSCRHCGQVVTCPHLYYEGQIRSVSATDADAVTGYPLPRTGSSTAGSRLPSRVPGHQARSTGDAACAECGGSGDAHPLAPFDCCPVCGGSGRVPS